MRTPLVSRDLLELSPHIYRQGRVTVAAKAYILQQFPAKLLAMV